MTGAALTQKRMQPEDVDRFERDVQRLWESNLAYCRAAGELDADDGLPAAHGRGFLQVELARRDARVHLYLEDDDVVALTAELVPHPREAVPWIGLLLVDGRRHGQQVGARCAALVHEQLAREGWQEVRLAVLDTNPRALTFWQRHGYQSLDRRQDSEGRWCVVLRRPLHEADA